MSKKQSREESKKEAKDLRIEELTSDLQRLRADFENYRKNADEQKVLMKKFGAADAIKRFLPVLDGIERAIKNIPDDLKDNPWVQGIANLDKNLDRTLADFGVERIAAEPGTIFDPNLHHAVAVEEAAGDTEVIAEELQAGYKLDGDVLREAMVKVTNR